MQSTEPHPFVTRPHRTLLALSFPVLFSLIAEPLTGLIDTGFVSRLGSVGSSALGVGAIALSSTFWVFNFLGISTQTEVAQRLGRGETERAKEVVGLGMSLAFGFGILLWVIGAPFAGQLARFLGAEGEVLTEATRYIQFRLIGAPAVLLAMTGMAALRGKQDMTTPLYIAVSINVLNILLDWPLIFGLGPIPALGVGGAGLASSISQWIGAVFTLAAVVRQIGRPAKIPFEQTAQLLRVGGDLFIRTGALMLFLILATRVATLIGADSGAANQGIRQIWIFTALFLEAYAMTGQSLVGYFYGSGDVEQSREVARVSTIWSIVTGVVLGGVMLAAQRPLANLFVPESAHALFFGAWWLAAVMQPINSLAFITDGIHWGTGDYGYLRNGMVVATLTGGIALALIDTSNPDGLIWVWVAQSLWIAVRGTWGIIRIWPGVGRSPLAA